MSQNKSLDSLAQLKLLSSRQIDDKVCKKVQSSLQVTDSSISRLGLEKELEGHTGCVNCLEWNESGTVLASASDDVRFILWDPFRYRRLHVFETGHVGNIFSVKFLPKTKDNTIVTAAGDCRVKVHDIQLGETTMVCSCHMGRVKRIATAPNLPYMFWSAAEDGLIMEFDLRAPHVCNTQINNVLISLSGHLGRYAEAKCLAINATRPELLAVGANDPYIRLYDRRMIRPVSIGYPQQGRPKNTYERYQYVLSSVENNLTDGAVQYFVAGHLPSKHSKKKHRNFSSTYLTFSPSGNDLLVNLGGEQIYLFDINNRRKFKTYDLRLKEHTSGTNGYTTAGKKPENRLSPHPKSKEAEAHNLAALESLKLSANRMFDMQHYTSAIREYNKALNICSNWAILYGNRAAAYMKRGWDGDMYAALRDCSITLQLDPSHLKAHFRLAKCLFELNHTEEAKQCLADFKAKFPDQAHSRACKALSMDILAADKSVAVPEELEKPKPEVEEENRSSTSKLASEQETKWRIEASDYEARFCGHCNTTTDIKEANFFGSDGQYIVAGSDDGSFFIWNRHTTNILQVLKGDDSIVNCLQPHPSACLLATSGIDSVVRLWSPLPEDGGKNERAVINLDAVASENQLRMNSDPFEVMLMNMGYRIAAASNDTDDEMPSEGNNWVPANVNCRPS